eukprot:TRINITY_DN68031_c6_g7_i1.p1 TRINITY_DN68031_c6_g7~~TRINITY_DN68031_c6_g7_i1.p1  ORF type:complete len:336 (-),score=61.98 TRINITY_DN68031_c6_g7_i1:141-1073(-)
MNTTVLNPEALEALASILPTDEEVKGLQKETEGKDMETLGPEVQFVLQVGTIPHLQERISCWLLTNTFSNQVQQILADIEKLATAINAVRNSDNFKKILRLVLEVGNLLNEGTNRICKGFSITQLPQVVSMKSVDNESTLLEFLVVHVMKKFPQLVDFTDELAPVAAGKSVQMKDITAAVTSLATELTSLKSSVQQLKQASSQDSNGQTQQKFVTTLEEFQQFAGPTVEELKATSQKTQEELQGVCEYFGEDAKSWNQTDFFAAVVDFCKDFALCHKEQVAKLEKETKDREKEKKKKPPPPPPRPEPKEE